MRTKLNRVLAILTVLMMVFNMIPTSVLAETTSGSTSIRKASAFAATETYEGTVDEIYVNFKNESGSLPSLDWNSYYYLIASSKLGDETTGYRWMRLNGQNLNTTLAFKTKDDQFQNTSGSGDVRLTDFTLGLYKTSGEIQKASDAANFMSSSPTANIAGYTVTNLKYTKGTKNAVTATVTLQDPPKYTVNVNAVKGEDETEIDLTGNYYIRATWTTDSNTRYAYAALSTGETNATVTFDNFFASKNESAYNTNPVRYDGTGDVAVALIADKENTNRKITDWDFNEAQFENGSTVGKYSVSVTDDVGNNTTNITLTAGDSRTVLVKLYDYDGTTPYDAEHVKEDYKQVAGSWMLRVTAKDAKDNLYYAFEPIDISNAAEVSKEIYAFQAKGEDSAKISIPSNNSVLLSNGLTIKDVRIIDQKQYTWAQVGNDDAVTDKISGFAYKSNKTEGNTTTIQLNRSYKPQMKVRLVFEPEGSSFKETDYTYLFVEVEHQSGGKSYYLKNICFDESALLTDDNGNQYYEIPVPNWMDDNGNPKNDSFTGGEKSVTVSLIKAANSINMNTAIAGNQISKIAAGDFVKAYTVDYGATTQEDNDQNYTSTTLYEIDFLKHYATKDYTYASILGDGINYGFTVDRFKQGESDVQSNFATNYYQDGGKGVNPNLSGDSAGAIAVGNYVQFSSPDSYTIDSNGKIFIGSSHQLPDGSHLPILLYTDSANRVRDYRDFVHTVVTSPSEVANNIVNPIIQHMQSMSASLLNHDVNVPVQVIGTKAYVDATMYDDDVTLYVDADAIAGYISEPGNLVIKKRENQTIVFNYDSTEEVAVREYLIETYDGDGNLIEGLSGNSAPNTDHGSAINVRVDNLARTIVWNLNSAKKIITSSTAGVFLSPKADSEFVTETTSSGWIVSAGYFYNKGEWHYVYADLKDVDKATLHAYKTVDSKVAASNQKFNFTFEYWNPVEKEWQTGATVQNKGGIVSYTVGNELNEGWNVFKITESAVDESTVGTYTIDTATYYAAVQYVKYVSGNSTKYVAGSPSYYKEFVPEQFSGSAAQLSGLSQPVGGRQVLFENHLKKGDLKLTKEIRGIDSTQDDFTFEIKIEISVPSEDNQEETLPLNGIYEAEIIEGANVTTKRVQFNEGILVTKLKANQTLHILGLPAGAEYTIRETKVGKATYHEGKYVQNWKLTSKDGYIGTIGDGDVQTSVFVNTYKTEDCEETLEGVKKLVDANGEKDLNGKQFQFTATAAVSNPTEGIDLTRFTSTVSNNGSTGFINFGTLRFTAEGTWIYTVTETSESDNEYTKDQSEYQVRFVVTQDEDTNELTVVKTIKRIKDAAGNAVNEDAQSVDAISFTNRETKTSAVIKAKKDDSGNINKDIERKFTFSLYTVDKDGNESSRPVETSREIGAGETYQFTYSGLNYTKADLGKTYQYRVKENHPAVDGTNVVEVIDNRKVTGYLDKTTGITYTAEVHDIQFTIRLDNNGNLVAEPVGSDTFTTHVFRNKYEASGEAVFSAKKTANPSLSGKTFEFDLFLLTTETNDLGETVEREIPLKHISGVAAGTERNFDAIPYTLEDLQGNKSATFTYRIRETIPADAQTINGHKVKDGITYDESYKDVTVVVTDDTNGNLVVTYDGSPTFETPEFTNTYSAKGEETLKAKKAISGKAWPTNGKVTFTLAAVTNGAPMPAAVDRTRVLTEAGEVSFGKIDFTLADAGKTYEYKITETTEGFDTGWTGSDPITATIKVTDIGGGKLDTEVTYTPSTDTITNTYSAKGEETLKAKKEISGKAWPAEGKVTFTLAAVTTGAPMPAAEDQTKVLTDVGEVSFGKINFTLADAGKTYEYKITETTEGFDTGWTGSDPITAKIEVTDEGAGKIGTKVTYTPDTDTITNTYSAKGEETLKATKAISGKEWPANGKVTFTLAAVTTGAPMPATEDQTRVLTKAEEVEFGKINFTLADAGKTYEYKITETTEGFDAGWKGSDPITAKIEVTDAGAGKIGTNVTYTPATDTITNTYSAEGEETLKAKKAISGKEWPTGGKVTFTLAAETTGAPMPAAEEQTKVLTEPGEVSFGKINFTLADAGKTYEYKITETTEGFDAGWTGSAPITATIKVTYEGAGKIGTKVTYTPDTDTITNTYSAKGEETLKAKKAISGKEWPTGGKVTFTLAAVTTGAPMPAAEDQTRVLTKAEEVEFGKIKFTLADAGKTYEYKITETTEGFDAGWTGSDPITAKIEVKDAGEGKIGTKVTYTPDTDTITNTYSAKGEETLKAKKAISGKAWPTDGKVTFTLEAVTNGAPMPAAEDQTRVLTKAEEVEFGKIKFTLADAGKTYEYKITETTEGFDTGWTGSDPITAKIEVTDEGAGKIGTKVTYTPDTDTITNTYSAKGEETLKATKAISGKEWPANGKVTFTLAAVTTGAPMPATEDQTRVLTKAEEVEFGKIKFTLADAGKTYEYKITETTEGFDTGWTGSDPITAKIKVTDVGEGKLDTEVTYTPSTETITNTYSAKGEETLKAKKAISGKAWPTDGKVTFTLEAVTNGAPMPATEDQTRVLTKAEEVEFGKIKFTLADAGKTYEYKITETTEGFDTGWTGSDPITAKIEVTDEGAGKIGTKVTYTPATDTITNTYSAKGEETLKAKKAISGKAWPTDGKVTFTLAAVTNGAPMPAAEDQTKVLTEVGEVSFGKINFTLADAGKIYEYKITETTEGFDAGWKGSDPITATIKVTDVGEGKLDTEVTYTPSTDTITNTYSAKGEETLKAKKEISGKAWPAEGKVTFTLAAVTTGAPMPAAEDQTKVLTDVGEVSFGKINFTLADDGKTYEYRITETTEGFDTGWEGSDPITAKIKVTDAGEGKLDTEVTYTPSTDTITNTYSAEGELNLTALKELDGRDLEEGEFTFELKEGENLLDSQKNDADGKVTFKTLTYSLDDLTDGEGTKVYTISEVKGMDQTVIYDNTITEITVTLKDEGDGVISATPDKTGALVTFKNKVTEVKVSKVDVADGKELEGAKIQILQKDENGKFEIDGVKYTVVEEWTSGKESHEVKGLKTGEEYILHEEVAPDGYTVTTDTKFTIDETGKVTSSGTITEDGILLVEDAMTSVKVSKVDVADGKELEGAKIQILQKDENGKVEIDGVKYTVVEEWTSGKEPHEVKGLKTGEEYILHEEVAPDGYTVTADTKFTIDETGKVTSTGTVTEDGILLVEDAMTSVKVSKVDVADGKELEGATIQILQKDENGEVEIDGVKYTVVEEWISGKEPYEVKGLKTGEEYILHEEVAPDGYTVTTDTTFTIDETGKVTSTGTITEDGILLVEDAMTSVKISKVDVADGKELEGAKIQILQKDENGKVEIDGVKYTVVEEWTSGKEPHEVKGLKTGEEYTLHETVAPDGYDLTSDTTFVIDETGKVTSTGNTKKNEKGETILLVEDALLKGRLEIEKVFDISEITPEPTPTPSVTPTPEPTETPEPTPEVTPEPTPEVPETIDIPVMKEWDDGNNHDGNRPAAVNVQLLADGAIVATATLTEASGWTYTFAGMPRMNGDAEIAYTVKEEPVAWYETEIINGTHIVNHYRPITTSVTVRKIWDDNNNEAGMRPTGILMKLNNGMNVVLNAANGWTATISDLPVMMYGQPMSYSWTEQEVLGYTQSEVSVVGNTTIFTNYMRRRPENPPEDKKVTKQRGNSYVIIEDYGTPLGVDVVINHVGDCFD